MIKRFCLFAMVSMVSALLFVSVAGAQQFQMLNMVAEKVIQKYQQSNCLQLWEQKNQPKTELEQEFIQMLRSDPQAREMFINKVAGPIVNKLFECGMIP